MAAPACTTDDFPQSFGEGEEYTSVHFMLRSRRVVREPTSSAYLSPAGTKPRGG